MQKIFISIVGIQFYYWDDGRYEAVESGNGGFEWIAGDYSGGNRNSEIQIRRRDGKEEKKYDTETSVYQ